MTGHAAVAASLLMASSAAAALSFASGYSGVDYYSHGGADGIYSYDWGSDGHLYYGTATPSFTAGGIYRYDGVAITTIKAASADFAGASVVGIGSSIFFNDSTPSNLQRIHQYDIGSGSTTSVTVTNYALGSDGSHLLTTGSADFLVTRLTYYPSGVSGATIDLGGIDGASGPVAVDAAGNLFYAPGYGDLGIYRWTAAEVAAAVSGNGIPALSASGHLWLDYSGSFAGVSGATSLLLDAGGSVLVTLTDFSAPSSLVRFSADGSGSYETLLTSDERLGELRQHDGNLYLSDGNRILVIIPEPSVLAISLLGIVPGLMLRRRP